MLEMWSLFPNLMTLFVPQVHIISLALSNASCCQSRAGEQLLSSTNAVDMYSPQVYLFLFLKLLTTSSHCTEWKFPWTVCPSALTGHLQSKARLLVIARTHHYTLLRPATAPTNRHKTAHTIYIYATADTLQITIAWKELRDFTLLLLSFHSHINCFRKSASEAQKPESLIFRSGVVLQRCMLMRVAVVSCGTQSGSKTGLCSRSATISELRFRVHRRVKQGQLWHRITILLKLHPHQAVWLRCIQSRFVQIE